MRSITHFVRAAERARTSCTVGRVGAALCALVALGACSSSSKTATNSAATTTVAGNVSPGSTAAPSSATSAAGTNTPAGPCDVVSPSEIQSVYGGSVANGTTTDLDAGGCKWAIAGGSEGQAFLFYYPGNGASYSATMTDPVGYVHDQKQQAISLFPGKAGDYQDVSGVGDAAYIDNQTLTMTIASRPNFAFREQYVRGASNRLQPPTAHELDQLKAMAAKIIAAHHG